MTRQVPDEVRYLRRTYHLTALDGSGLFDPGEHGVTPTALSTACYRGFMCGYAVRGGRLLLDSLEIGAEPGAALAGPFGAAPERDERRSFHRGTVWYSRLARPVGFTGRLLIGADEVHVGYLNMGFLPAWLYARVHELAFDAGRLTAAHDRSDALAEVRERLGEAGLKPREGEPTRDWIHRTFSQAFEYSWPSPV
jgi:hypothetical protein